MDTSSIGAPAGRQTTLSAEGGIDLRVAAPRKRALCAGAWVAATGWIALTVARLVFGRGPTVTPPVALAGAAFLITFAVWCTLGDERWHIDTNVVEHRVGIGVWFSRRRYVDAELQIVRRFSTKFDRPYYRLHAVCGDARHLLMERGRPELLALQELIAAHTGWRILEESRAPD